MTDQKNNLPELPKGWVWTNLQGLFLDPKNEIVDGPFGSNLKASEYRDFGIPIVRLQNIDRNVFIEKNIKYITNEKAELLKRHNFMNGDVVMTKLGAPLGKACIIPIHIKNGIIVADVVRLCIRHQFLDKKYLVYAINSEVIAKQLEDNTKGTTRPRVNLNHIRELKTPLPPLPEQHRIVTKIEELFTRLDAGVEALKKIKTQIKRYRQAVLKYAFEGKLTAEWREKHKDELEPASVLLERIRKEPKKAAKGEYKEPSPVDITDLPTLPEGWVWTRVGSVSKTIQYGTSEKANDDPNGIPVIRMGNILGGTIIFDKLKYFPNEWQPLEDFVLQNGDVLFNRTNSMELVGKTAVYKDCHPKAVFASYLIRVRLREDSYIPELLSFFINSFYGRRYITSVVSQQVGQANVNGTKLSFMPIPMPLFAEQHSIVQEIERRFSVADEIEKVIDQSLKQADRLRQSILKRAFEGKLVPQDPSDEPAEKLLERIKTERESRGTEGKIQNKGKKKKDSAHGRHK